MTFRHTGYPFRQIRLLAFLLMFLGVSALYGGYSLMADPGGRRLQMSKTILTGTPFHDFFLPGLFLFFGLGIGSLVSLLGFALRSTCSIPCSALAGIALLVWILVQVLLVGYISWLQPFYAFVGAAIAVLAIRAARTQP